MIATMDNISWGTRCTSFCSESSSIHKNSAGSKNNYFLKNSCEKLPPTSDVIEEKFWANLLSPGMGTLSPLSASKKKERTEKMEHELKKFRCLFIFEDREI